MVDHSKRVELKTFPHIKILVYESSEERDTWVVKLLAQVRCVETGELISVGTDMRTHHPGEFTSEELTQHVRELFFEHMRHEFEEGLFIDGHRPFNPHPGVAAKT